jgi:hypothetical protein
MHAFLHLILVAGCVIVALLALAVCLFFLAFADSPESNKAAVRAMWPALVYILIAEAVAGHFVRNPVAWWSYVLAYVIVATPPVVLIGLTFALMSWGKRGK